MQVSQAEEKIVRRVGVEEEQIRFRPSPNFKNMKKFIKSRSDYETTLANPKISTSPAVEHPPVCEPVEAKEKKPVVLPPHIVTAPPKQVVVQPPLPPYPPPDSPPLNVTIKQEREEEDEEAQNHSGGEGDLSQEIQPTITEKQDTQQNQAKPKKIMCKEYIRGNCKWPVCKYAHEIDISQLEGVFTFCWNYQNDVCTFPNCRFVHASVFEEQQFYRTGVLPPHARSHMKKQQEPPLPPPEENKPLPQPQPEIRPANFANPPPQHHTSSVEQVEDFRTSLPRSTSPLKREWAEVEDFNTSPRELEPIEHMAKKCKNCEIMDISLKYNKEMMENMMQLSAELNKKIGLINKKNNKLYSVLFTVLKTSNKMPFSNGLITGGEKEKLMLEKIKTFVGSNHSFSSLVNDDRLKNMVGGNVTVPSFMAKLLCSAGEQTMPTDTSRET